MPPFFYAFFQINSLSILIKAFLIRFLEKIRPVYYAATEIIASKFPHF
jgi:hypothetical protein